eukprot:GEMP01091743.1.p1 GENE.GEMP01091743.1~~GEMP01091743.1.p1  ORF type:complete len:121 (+),score=23.47 GEMP01091743.1:208-570(+)
MLPNHLSYMGYSYLRFKKYSQLENRFRNYGSAAQEKIHAQHEQLFHRQTMLNASQKSLEKVEKEFGTVKRECTILKDWRSQCGGFFKEKYAYEEEHIRSLEQDNDRLHRRICNMSSGLQR